MLLSLKKFHGYRNTQIYKSPLHILTPPSVKYNKLTQTSLLVSINDNRIS